MSGELITNEQAGSKTATGESAIAISTDSDQEFLNTFTLSPEDLALINCAMDDNRQDGELQLSRLALLQPTGKDSSALGNKPGMMVDSRTREVLSDYIKPPWLVGKVSADEIQSKHCCLIMPVLRLPNEYIQWKDLKTEGRGMHWKTLDSSDPRVIAGVWPKNGGVWGTIEEQKNVAPPVTININFLNIIVDIETKSAKGNFIVTTFCRTSYGCGETLINHVESHKMRGLMPWGCCYWLHSLAKSNPATNDSVYHVFQVARGPVSSIYAPGLIPAAQKMALYLADIRTGKQNQQRLINSADLETFSGMHEDDESSVSSGNLGRGEIIDSEFSAPGSAAINSTPKF